jgi:hypothetical protein
MAHEVDRLHNVFAFGVPSTSQQPWNPVVWPKIEAEFAFLNHTCRAPIALRGRQDHWLADGSIISRGLGRLSWNAASSARWTTPEPVSVPVPPARLFGHIEAWAPHWNQCFSGRGTPDFYMKVQNIVPVLACPDHATRGEVMLAIAADFPAGIVDRFEVSVLRIAELLGCSHVGVRQMPWAIVTKYPELGGIESWSEAVNSIHVYRYLDPSDRLREAHELMTPDWTVLVLRHSQ